MTKCYHILINIKVLTPTFRCPPGSCDHRGNRRWNKTNSRRGSPASRNNSPARPTANSPSPSPRRAAAHSPKKAAAQPASCTGRVRAGCRCGAGSDRAGRLQQRAESPLTIDPGTSAGAWAKNDAGYYFNSDGEPILAATKKGIDVSKYQGEVDWEKAQAAGIDLP